MAPQQPLSKGMLVWAKVEPYPWWPGRIVQSIYQQRQQVFKIAFFADPTYTFLHHHQIQPFQDIHLHSNEQLELQPALHKAVRMAVAQQLKGKATSDRKTDSQACLSSPQMNLPQRREEEEQNSIISSQREGMWRVPKEQKGESMYLEQSIDKISSDNVLRLLEKLHNKTVRSAYCYQKRKEQVKYQDRLKCELLKRYNLHSYDSHLQKMQKITFQHSFLQITVTPQPQLPHKPYTKIQKHIHSKRALVNEHIDSLSIRCARKINLLLRNNQDSSQKARQHSIQLVKRMLVLADNSHQKLKSLFVTLVRAINGPNREVSCEQQLGDFRHYLQRLEGEKGEDEEGSKITQLQTSVN